MANAKDITSAASNILVIGDSGTHKTWFLRTMPANLVFDFDLGMSINRGQDLEYFSFRDAPKGTAVSSKLAATGVSPWGDGWPKFIKKLNEIGTEIEAGKRSTQTISLDSLTFMGDLALNHVLRTTAQDIPHQGSWGAQQQYLMTVLGQLCSWPIRLVATAHIQRNDNDITGVTEKLPLVTGKLAGKLSAYFDEVYFAESATDAKGSQSFTVKTKATPSMRQAKSRWGVPDGTTLDYAAIKPFLEPAP